MHRKVASASILTVNTIIKSVKFNHHLPTQYINHTKIQFKKNYFLGCKKKTVESNIYEKIKTKLKWNKTD